MNGLKGFRVESRLFGCAAVAVARVPSGSRVLSHTRGLQDMMRCILPLLCLSVPALACNNDEYYTCQAENLLGIICVLGVSALCSCCVFGASWLCGLWEMDRKPTLAMIPVPFVVTALCALAPPLSRDQPGRCFAMRHPDPDLWYLQRYGVEVVVMLSALMGVSWAGLCVSIAWLYQAEKTALGTLAVKYSVSTALLNTIGLLGWTLGGCKTAGVETFDIHTLLFGLSCTGSFLTNVLLQKIVIVRTETHSGRGEATWMRRSVYGEYIAGATILIGGMLHAGTRGHGIVRGGKLFASAYMLGSLLLLVFDSIFSWQAYVTLQRALQQAQSIMPVTSWASKMSAAVAVAKVNLRLVLLAVLGTSLHYTTLLVVAAWFCFSPMSFVHFKFYHLLLPMWCLDSIFNDLCALYIGCGPTQAGRTCWNLKNCMLQLLPFATLCTVLEEGQQGFLNRGYPDPLLRTKKPYNL